MNQFDLFGGKAARDSELTKVADNSGHFMQDAMNVIARIPSGTQMTGEDIRRSVSQAGVMPHHHNAWGALIARSIKRKLLVPTGQHRHMRAVRSHARQTPVYRRT